MERTGLCGHDPMGTFRKKADHILAAPLADGKLQFVAVGIFFFAALACGDGKIEPGDLSERIFDHARFEFELHVVLQMLQLTAAALSEHGAFGTDAHFGGREQIFDPRVGNIPLDFEYAHLCALSGKQAWNEQNRAVLAARDPFPLRAESRAGHFQDIVLFHAIHLLIRRIAPFAAFWQRKIM